MRTEIPRILQVEHTALSWFLTGFPRKKTALFFGNLLCFSKHLSCRWKKGFFTAELVTGLPVTAMRSQLNPLHINISIYILHTVLYTFPKVLTRWIYFFIILRAYLVGDHFLYSCDPNRWFRGDIVRRN